MVPVVASKAYRYVFLMLRSASVRKKKGVGKGKNDASAKAHKNMAHPLHFVVAQCRHRLFNFSIQLFMCHLFDY
jgi:hypothetical protein